jgi:hypothetical protein
MKNRILTLACAVALGGGLLAACGDDGSTVDSSDVSSTPSVAPGGTRSSGSASATSPVETTTPSPHSGNGEDAASGITEVTELPPESAVRNDKDHKFLDELKSNGLEIKDQIVQDQVIAVANDYCRSQSSGEDTGFILAVAGQLQGQGVTDKDPEQVASVIRDAASSTYCGA